MWIKGLVLVWSLRMLHCRLVALVLLLLICLLLLLWLL